MEGGLRFHTVTTLIVILIAQCVAQDALQQPKSTDLRSDGIQVLMASLSKAGVSASLEFSGLCNSTDFPSFRFPTGLDRPSIQIVLDMFSENPEMQVWQGTDGIIRISGAETPEDLLRVRISRVTFSKDQATDRPLFDPTEATWAILSTPEVRQFAAVHKIEWHAEALHLPHAPLSAQSPHVSGYLTNVTVSQALDYLFKTFPGLWIYEDCPGTVKFSFYANNPNWGVSLRDLERRNGVRLAPHN
jgi:hypothetical protein